MSKTLFTTIILIVLGALGAAYYWFFVRTPDLTVQTDTSLTTNSTFSPFGTTPTPKLDNTQGLQQNGSTAAATTTTPAVGQIPALRQLSTTPVGGMMASTTASSTIVRWIDRGVGHIYQAYSENIAITEISNTTIPRVYESYWNKKADALIFRTIQEDSDVVTSFYTELKKINTGTSTASTSVPAVVKYELRGSALPKNTTGVAISPKGDSVFTLTNESGTGIGYTSLINGQKRTQIFSGPLTQLNIEWPEDNTISLTTKGSSLATGFLYFVNPKNGNFNKIIGGVRGLSTLTSRDAKKVLYSESTDTSITTSIFDVKSGSSQSLAFNTLPEKCVWSTVKKDEFFCAVPSQIPEGSYPEAWYQGTISFSDKIWHINATTGEVHLVADLLSIGKSIIDAQNLQLDPKENYLYFINKKDLTLWSLSLNS
jgi:hypothetical protein